MEIQNKIDEINRYINEYIICEDILSTSLKVAINKAITNGGKRIRPLLMLETYKMLGGKELDFIKPFMAAIEFIHTFSLIHDDLPCIDNDILRRGQKSTWAEFGEATAILAGDSLFIEAFYLPLKYMSKIKDKDAAFLKSYSKALEILAYNSGIRGMISGEAFDVEVTNKDITKDELKKLIYLKTSCLIIASMKIGATLAGADADTILLIEDIAAKIGECFQIRDDILGKVSTSEKLGKTVGLDEKNGKNTYVKLFGLEYSKKYIQDNIENIIETLEKKFKNSNELVDIIKWLNKREK